MVNRATGSDKDTWLGGYDAVKVSDLPINKISIFCTYILLLPKIVGLLDIHGFFFFAQILDKLHLKYTDTQMIISGGCMEVE